jgi:ubiquinone/menaquinone biosynthesis C-methylase UbiE
MRVLEIGCGTGAAAREVARRITPGHVLAIDRSASAIATVERSCREEIGSGWMSVRQAAVEDLSLEPGEERFDLAFAVRVGALDGRHPELEERARARIRAALVPGGELIVR